MDPNILAIRARLRALGARERLLLLGRAALQVVAVAALSAVLAGVGLSAGLSRVVVLGWVGALGGLGLWVAFSWPLLGRWRQAADPRTQARRLEGLVPALRSRLMTALDGAAAVEAGTARFSRALWARAVAGATELSLQVPVAVVHPLRALRRPLLLLGVALSLSALSGALFPIGPIDAMGALWSGSAATARLAAAEVPPVDARALVGDIVLRYVFPDYTGLAPLEIPNSDGTIHAPPGTMVTITARTAEPFEAAALQAYEHPPVDCSLGEGRNLSASLVVEGEGVWRFLLFRGREVQRSPDYKIVVEADAPPVVTTSSSALEAAVDQPLDLGWQANDDYGLDRVELEIEVGGKLRSVPLRDPLDVPLTLADHVGKTPRELGLRPGETATLRVVAYDNDQLAGARRGASPDVRLTVLGPRGQGARLSQYHLALRDALLVVLADFLEDPTPPGTDSAGLTRWATSARGRFDRVREIVEAQWSGEAPDGIEGTVVSRVLETAARLFRFTQTAFDPAVDRPPSAKDLETLASLTADQIQALELATWMLDALLRNAALQDVASQAADVAQEAAELKELASTDASASELLSRVDQLERQLHRLADAAARLGEGQMREFVNARSREASDLIAQVRKAIAEGRMDDARAMLDQLSTMLQDMSDGLGDQLAASQETDDTLKQRMEELQKDLAELEKDQKDLADKLTKGRQSENGAVKQVVDAWAKLDPLAGRALGLACGAAALPGDGTGWRAGTVRKLGQLCEAATDLQGAVRARDAGGAARAVLTALNQQRYAEDQVDLEASRPRINTEAVPEGVADAQRALAELGPVLEQMKKILDQLQRQNVSMSPEMRRAAQQLSSDQAKLQDRQQQLGSEVQKVERALPTGDGSAARAMGEAGDAMQRARQSLESGDGLSGEGHQRYAADQVSAARRILQQREQEAQQMSSAMQAMGNKGQGKEGGQQGGKGSGNQSENHQIEIPAPESFQTPEAYRKALLEGMEGDVPEEYRALKQRYYEELVRQ